jgi:sortase A
MITGVRNWLARLLVFAGALALVWAAYTLLSSRRAQLEYRKALEATRTAPPAPPAEPSKPALPLTMPLGEPIGTLRVPRLGLSAVVAEGDDKPVLDNAAGHLPDTALPWNDGNAAVAAHRDGLFRPLKDIKVGDTLHFDTVHGDFEYKVTERYVVEPDDIWVLNPTLGPTLTLISCYPFNFIGNAPKRFIVKAERLPVVASNGQRTEDKGQRTDQEPGTRHQGPAG